jgi:hypothetical protein
MPGGITSADLHAGHAFIPALDYPARAQRKREGLPAIDGGVEFFALAIGGRRVVEPARVVNNDGLSFDRFGTGAHGSISNLQLRHRGIQLALRSSGRGIGSESQGHSRRSDEDGSHGRGQREGAQDNSFWRHDESVAPMANAAS